MSEVIGQHDSSGVPVDALELFAQVLAQSEQSRRPDQAPSESAFYDGLCGAICRIANQRRAIIFRYDPERRQVEVAGSHNLDVRLAAGRAVSIASAWIAADSLERDEVIEISGDLRPEFPEQFAPLLQEPMRLACVPMTAAGRAVGIMLFDRAITAPALDERERHLLWTLGKAAALASVARTVTRQVENARQLRQRIDLAREVHEGVIQRLFGVSMVLDGEGDLPADVRARCAAETQSALTELRDAIQRPLSRELRYTRLSFAAELQHLQDANPELPIKLAEGALTELPSALEPLAQSVLSEAVRNARKHAHPTSLSIESHFHEGNYVLEINNDGVPGDARRQPGVGLRLAAFEALQSGGIVEFGAREGGQWQVRLVVPGDDQNWTSEPQPTAEPMYRSLPEDPDA
jgi:signal transduction histidine kinase